MRGRNSYSFFSGAIRRNTFEYSYMKCLYNKLNSTSKMVSKCIRIASTDIFNLKNFSGEVPEPPYEKVDNPPLVLSPCSGLWPSRNAYGVQWPYHFSKTDDGPALCHATLKRNHANHVSCIPRAPHVVKIRID